MNRPWFTWTVFAACLAVVVAAMGWTSLTVLRLEEAQAGARRQATLEENVRLTLWRMDSALAPLIARESTWPYFAYSPFYPAERAYTRMFAAIERGEVLVPSPLLDRTSPYVLLHFQIGPDGGFTSPQVPTDTMRDLAESGYTTGEKIERAARRLADLQDVITRNAILAHLEPPESAPIQVAILAPEEPQQQAGVRQSAGPMQQPSSVSQFDRQRRATRQQQQIELQQQVQALPQPQSKGNYGKLSQPELNVRELQARGSNLFNNAEQIAGQPLPGGAGPMDVHEGLAKPLWIGDVLLLARRIRVNSEDYVQACRLDWPAIRDWLQKEAIDLLPESRLEPVRDGEKDNGGRVLAALPVRLVPGSLPLQANGGVSPIRASLAIAWAGLLLAAVAVAALMQGAVSLSERRGAFVSAVTHEMRTPLTTFRMYTEMLLKGMVPDDAKRQHYLNTLRVEADRLGHLVENVLAYARLERGRFAGRSEPVTLEQVLARVSGRLADRAEQAGMRFEAQPMDCPSTLTLCADVSVIEQILFNLVDNACKYAATASDRTIALSIAAADGVVSMRVRDHGPGLSGPQRRRLFQAFCKSAREAAHSAPGVGLGLALSRRLARQLDGDLHLDDSVTHGACFVLTLPAG